MRDANNRRKYQLKITYIDGDVEYVKFNGIDNTNKKEVDKVYVDVKNNHPKKDKILTIEYLSIDARGIARICFTKEMAKPTEKEKFIKENINTDIREIVSDVLVRLELLKQMTPYHQNKLSECDRLRSEYLHKIAATKNKKFVSEKDKQDYKNKIFEGQENNENQRRLSKQNIQDLNSMFEDIKLEDMIKNMKRWANKRVEYKETPDQFEERVRKEFTYKTEKERIKLIAQYQNKYDFVNWYSLEKKLVFIGHVGSGKRKYKNKNFKTKKIN